MITFGSGSATMALAFIQNIVPAFSKFLAESIRKDSTTVLASVSPLSKKLSLEWAARLDFNQSQATEATSGLTWLRRLMPDKRAILLVEDNEDDVFLMERALAEARVCNPLFIVEDGEQAVDYMAGQGKFTDRSCYPLPAIIFLDLKLPYKSGHDVLAWLRGLPQFDSTVLIILTSSDEPRDLATAYRLGANSYLVKPPTASQLVEMAKSFKWYWLDCNRFDLTSPSA